MGTLELQKEVQALQEQRLLWTLAVIQGVSDSRLALLDNLSSRQNCMAQVGEQGFDGDSELRREVQALQKRRLLRTLAVIQDISDSSLALNDIRGDFSPLIVHCTFLPILLILS